MMEDSHPMSAAPSSAPTSIVPRRLVVERAAMMIEGNALTDVSLGGWMYGPAVGSAPVIVIVGGITASPFPFGDGGAAGGNDAWWPALRAPDLVDPERATILCPCWPGNGSTARSMRPRTAPSAVAMRAARAMRRMRKPMVSARSQSAGSSSRMPRTGKPSGRTQTPNARYARMESLAAASMPSRSADGSASANPSAWASATACASGSSSCSRRVST